MDRYEWSDGVPLAGEQELIRQSNIQLYDGDNKTDFEGGTLTVTDHRLLWRPPASAACLSLPLSCVVLAEKEDHTFFHSDKLVLHLGPAAAGRPAGPIRRSAQSHVKLAFRSGGMHETYGAVETAMRQRQWTQPAATAGTRAAGIVGIERRLAAAHHHQSQTISEAFRDLSQLMDTARQMVALSRQIADKITAKQGGISDDETVRFQAQLLSLGVQEPEPVTRATHGSGSRYHTELARQLAAALEPAVRAAGGMLTLTDAYCRLNRARGLELMAPGDLAAAAELMTPLALPLRQQLLPSGVRVLQLAELEPGAVATATRDLLLKHDSLTAAQLARQADISVLLAKQRLLQAETAGYACRDQSVHGLVFYRNRFLESDALEAAT